MTAFERVVAPFDGVITQRNVDVGALITAGSPTNNTSVAPTSVTGGAAGLFEDSQIDTLRVFVVVFQISPSGQRWNLPTTALIFNTDGTQVMLVGPGNKLQLQKVTVGRDFGDTIDIQEGLSGDETLVEQPDVALHDGQGVTPVENR